MTPDQAASPFAAARQLGPLRQHVGKIKALDRLPVTSAGDDYTLEGSGTITSIPACATGVTYFLRVKDNPVFKNSSKLICPNGSDYYGQPDDLVIARSSGNGIWRLYVLGNVGEYVSSIVPSGSAVALTTNVGANVTSISLAAGDWDVSGALSFNYAASTTVGSIGGGISLTSGSAPSSGVTGATYQWFYNTAGSALPIMTFGITPVRLGLIVPTTVYLVGFATFGTSTLSAFGQIRARRVR